MSNDALTSFDGLVAVSHASFATGPTLLGAAYVRLGLGAAANIRNLIERAKTQDTIVGGRFPDLEPKAWYPPECLPKETVAALQASLDAESEAWFAAQAAPNSKRPTRTKVGPTPGWVELPDKIENPGNPLEGCAGLISEKGHVHSVALIADEDGFGWIAEASTEGRGIGGAYRRIRTFHLPLSALGDAESQAEVLL